MKVKLNQIIEKPISGVWGDLDEENGLKVLRTTNFTNDGIINFNSIVKCNLANLNLENKILRGGDILIEKSGGSDKQPVGRVVYFDRKDEKFLFNNFTSCIRISDKKIWCARYVFYALYVNYLRGGTLPYQNKTTGLRNLKLDSYLNDFNINELCYGKQVEIVNQLDKVNDIIAQSKEQIEKLDLLIKSKFIELFGHQDKNEKNFTYGKINDVAEIYLGLTHTPNYLDNGVKFISAKNTSSDFLDLSEVKFISRAEYEHAPLGAKPRKGDILFSRVGSNLGHPVILETDEELCTFVSLGFLRTKGTVSNLYLKHWMRDDYFAEQVRQKVVGGGQPNLNTGWLKEFKIIIPPIELQNDFARFVDKIDKSKIKIKQSLEKLETLKKALMQKYFG